jgi:histidine triad (HIT) family protein
MPDSCLFCRMIQGDIATPVVYESEVAFAFLDHRPLFPGHCLVLPRRHIETLTVMPGELLGPFFGEVQLVARAVQTAMDAQGTFVAMNNRISQSVPHLHIHVVPRNRGDGLRGFFWPRTRYESADEEERTRALLQETIRALTDLPHDLAEQRAREGLEVGPPQKLPYEE